MKTCLTVPGGKYLTLNAARIAILNWLFAKSLKGKMLIRVAAGGTWTSNLDILGWLGVWWDEGPYYVEHQTLSYQRAIKELLRRGAAYEDFATVEEITAERKAASAAGRPFRYSRKYEAIDDRVRNQLISDDRSSVIRLKMPRQGIFRHCDVTTGGHSFDLSEQHDYVLRRSDGTFTEYLTLAVDYAELGITHAIVEEAHIRLMPMLYFIADKLQRRLPFFIHVPDLAEPKGKRTAHPRHLKRYLKEYPDFKKLYEHGVAIVLETMDYVSDTAFNPLVIDFYRKIGCLPTALVRYLLASACPSRSYFFEKKYVLTLGKMERLFAVSDISEERVNFNPTQLMEYQLSYMEKLSDKEKAWLVNAFLQKARMGSYCEGAHKAVPAPLKRTMQNIGPKLHFVGDVVRMASFLDPDMPEVEEIPPLYG